MAGKELLPGTTAAEELMAAGDIGLYRFAEPVELQREQRAVPVALIGRADSILREEVQVFSQVDMAVLEVEPPSGTETLPACQLRVCGRRGPGGATSN
jgi:hypothetical protein